MQLIFLGTASCYPTAARGVSCTALRFENGDVWLFDCGEGSQVQIQKSTVKAGHIKKIFITHLHGDHLFGLPGLICTLGNQIIDRPDFLLEIYGPLGLRRYIRESLSLSRSALPFRYIVHELIPEVEQLPEDWDSWNVDHTSTGNCHPQEDIGKDITEESGHMWNLCETSDLKVYAGAVLHRVPTYGFVVCEHDTPGQLDVERLRALNVPAGPLYGRIKRGESITLPSGHIIHSSDVIGPAKVGRKLTLLGDTKDAMPMGALAMDSDVLVHEATLEDAFVDKAKLNGHSTPSMAAAFSKHIKAKMLILYHFSQRYSDETAENNLIGSVELLVEEAKNALDDPSCRVIAAHDLMELTIPRRVKPLVSATGSDG